VARSGSKTWRKDCRWQGARRTFTIGAYPAVRLADARKQAESSNRPFSNIAQTWFDHHSASWSPRYCRDMREKLDHFVIRRCNDVARRVIEHAVDLELRQDNPAVKARKVIAATRVTHYHRISWVELPELLTVIDQVERQRLAERSSLIALRLMMLTLVRPSELREARWSEVDTQAGQWIIPAERMKTRVRHIVPLSSQARLLFDLQRPITGHTDLVFHTPNHRGSGELRVMSNGCLSMLLRRMGFQGWQTPHGFRGFGQTYCIEQLKIPRVVTEKQLAHADGNSVSRAYDWAEYLEERSDMLQRWADLLDQVAVTAGVAPVSELSAEMAGQPSVLQAA
jgi:integrase